MLTWAIAWIAVKTKRWDESLVVLGFVTAILDVAIVYVIMEAIVKAIG